MRRFGKRPLFHLKVRIGDMEVELGGDKDEVLSTLDELSSIVGKLTNTFEVEATLMLDYPKISRRISKCSDAVVALLTTDWGNSPRTISELGKAMEANAIFFPQSTLSGVLIWLTKKGQIRRWKDKTKKASHYLHMINEPETAQWPTYPPPSRPSHMGAENTGKGMVKVVTTGGSLTVSLPFTFVRANDIKKGDNMTVQSDGDRITYKPLLIEDITPVLDDKRSRKEILTQ